MIDKVNLSCDGSINEEESLYRGGSNTKSMSEGAIVSGQGDLHQDARGPPWCTIQEWIIIMSTCLAFSGIRIEISSTTADDLVTPNDKLNGNSQIWIEKSTWIFYDVKIRIWTVPRQPFCWNWVKPSNQNWPNLTMFFLTFPAHFRPSLFIILKIAMLTCKIHRQDILANLDFQTRKSCSQINFLSRGGEKQKRWFSHTALGVLFYIHRFLIYLTKYIFPLISGSGGGTIENGFIPIMYGQGDQLVYYTKT